MPELLTLKTFSDKRGYLSVAEDRQISFPIKRLFYIYGVDDSKRAGHRHKTTVQALISIKGGCKAHVNNGKEKKEFILNSPNTCLVLQPEDWHELYDFVPGS